MWPHEVEPWFHSWYRGRVETLDALFTLTPLYVATPTVQRELLRYEVYNGELVVPVYSYAGLLLATMLVMS